MQHNTRGVFFPSLNGLRFMAASAVMITHIELVKFYLRNQYNLKSYWFDLWGKWHNGDQMGHRIVESTPIETILTHPIVKWYHPIVSEAGPLGVVFFFVLSGFLITYLLFTEQDLTGTVAVRKFYIRRLLRIWPLYYLIVILGFLVLPQFGIFDVPNQRAILDGKPEHFWLNFGLFMVIFPNLAMSIFGPFPNIGQLWSIGVEEQFYIVWPVLIKKTIRPLRIILIVILSLILVKALVLALDGIVPEKYWDLGIRFFAMTKLESMAIGGLGAWILYHNKHGFLRLAYKPAVQTLAYAGIPLLLYFTPAFIQNGAHLIYSILFLVIILNVSTNPNSILKLENRIFHSLGKISYGLYMYHLLVITAVIHLVAPLFSEASRNGLAANLVFYGLSFAISIAISYLSYHFFESRFIRMKSRFTKVTSGDDARKQ
ncbi:MAG: acyltransferase family protein [Flavobacteriales bacterium]